MHAGTRLKEYPLKEIVEFVRVASVKILIKEKVAFIVACGIKNERMFVKTNKRSKRYLANINNGL